MFSRTKIFSLFILSLGLIIMGCNEDDDTNVMGSTPGTSNARVLHTSYDAPAVDVKVDGTTAISDLAYGQSSGYASLSAGSANVTVTPAGADAPIVIDADLVLEENKEYTVIATGPLASITAVVTEDDRSSISDKAKIRFAHMSPDAPAVDIKLNDGNGPVVFSNAAFKDVADYITVDGGTYTFAVTATGSTGEVVVFDPIAVTNDAVYTVVAHGTLDDTDNYPFAVRVFVDNGSGDGFVDMTTFGSANAMVIHTSPDAPGVDLLVDDAIAGTNLQFPNNTGYVGLTAGMRNIKVNVTGTATTVIEADLDLEKDKNYSIFAVDEVANLGALVIEDNLAAPMSGNAHVRFIHLSPNAPAVDITTTTGAIVFGDKSFKEYTDFTPLAAGSYDLQVRLQGTSTVVLELPGIALEDGKIYTVFAKGFVDGSDAQALGAEIIVNN
jgi:hypothetical protein